MFVHAEAGRRIANLRTEPPTMSDSIKRNRPSQALPGGYPNPLPVDHDGQTYNLRWHPASGRYRLRVRGYSERTYGPDPDQAMRDAPNDLPKLLAGKLKKPRQAGAQKERPNSVVAKAFGQTWMLKHHKSGDRTKRGLPGYVYCGHDPLAAPDIFREKVLPLLFPEVAPVAEPSAPFVTLEVALDEWLLTKRERVTKGRYDSYKSTRNVLLEEAADQMRRLPIEEISPRQWSTMQARILDRRKSYSSRADASRVVQEVKQLLFEAHDIKLGDLAGYFDPNGVTEGREELAPSLFQPEEIHQLLAHADQKWKAMVLWGSTGPSSRLTWRRSDGIRSISKAAGLLASE